MGDVEALVQLGDVVARGEALEAAAQLGQLVARRQRVDAGVQRAHLLVGDERRRGGGRGFELVAAGELLADGGELAARVAEHGDAGVQRGDLALGVADERLDLALDDLLLGDPARDQVLLGELRAQLGERAADARRPRPGPRSPRC